MTRTTSRTLLRGALLSVLAAQAASAAVVTRGPYLQMQTPSGIVVRWRTDTAETSRVAYGSAPGSLTQMADDLAVTTEHVVSVTGLTADTQYFYSVGSVTGVLVGDDADHYFRTAPTPGATQPIRIWSIGDAGFVGAALDAVVTPTRP